MVPHPMPKYNPEINTITVINPTLGMSIRENPIPTARAQKIAARTNLFSSILAFE